MFSFLLLRSSKMLMELCVINLGGWAEREREGERREGGREKGGREGGRERKEGRKGGDSESLILVEKAGAELVFPIWWQVSY